MIRLKQGGIIPSDSKKMRRAEEADLVTLPRDVTGTNCGNCRFAKKTGKYLYCAHKEVRQPVTSSQCCIFWDNPGSYRPWEYKV